MNRRAIIGVMGGGDADDHTVQNAYRLGRLVALHGWILLNGGRNAGVMAASAKGAKIEGGLTVGILPDNHRRHAAPDIDIPIVTGMGDARNCINVLSCDVVVACPGGAGTLSEIALALKSRRPVILLDFDIGAIFGRSTPDLLHHVKTPDEAIDLILKLL